MKNSSYLYVLLAVVMISCTKFGRTDTVKGRVMNPISGEGIPDRRVVLLKEETKLFGGSKIIKETLSDQEGNFEINAGRLKALEVSVVDDGKYFALGWYQDGKLISGKYANRMGLKKGKTLRADYYAVEYGEYVLNIKAVNCEGPNDTMAFRDKFEYDDNFGGYFPERYGCNSEITGKIKHPEGNHLYEIIVKRPSGVYNLTYQFYNSSNSVDTFNLFY
jgi:hypothetical protein